MTIRLRVHWPLPFVCTPRNIYSISIVMRLVRGWSGGGGKEQFVLFFPPKYESRRPLGYVFNYNRKWLIVSVFGTVASDDDDLTLFRLYIRMKPHAQLYW